MKNAELSRPRRLLELAAMLAVGLAAFSGYFASPVRVLLDSKYSLLTSEVLLRDRSWNLSRYVPRWSAPPGEHRGQGRRVRLEWQLKRSNGRLLDLYPPGSSLLSVPAVAVMNRFGLSSISPSGVYDIGGERRMQRDLSCFLSAVTVLLCTRLARRELPLPHAMAVGLVAAFGTALWSTASRSLWMHTWGTLLVAAALLELLRWDEGSRRRPELLGFLLVAAFWVRPTNAVVAAAMTMYVLWRHRAATLRLVGTGALGALGYLAYSRLVWGAPVQGYLRATRKLGRADVLGGALGLLIDPTRGMLVFSPFIVIALLVIARFGVARERRPFALLALAIFAGTFALYGSFRFWWAPGAVGCRFLTELSPILAWLGAHAWRRQREARARAGPAWRAGVTLAASLAVAASAVAHSTGAFDYGGSAITRAMTPPLKARRDPAGGTAPLSWMRSLPQQLPLAYWRNRLTLHRPRPRPAAHRSRSATH